MPTTSTIWATAVSYTHLDVYKRQILGDLKADGYEGFISLEPHLTEFEGLKGLEREGASLQGMQKMDGEEAFTIAFNALERILKAL